MDPTTNADSGANVANVANSGSNVPPAEQTEGWVSTSTNRMDGLHFSLGELMVVLVGAVVSLLEAVVSLLERLVGVLGSILGLPMAMCPGPMWARQLAMCLFYIAAIGVAVWLLVTKI